MARSFSRGLSAPKSKAKSASTAATRAALRHRRLQLSPGPPSASFSPRDADDVLAKPSPCAASFGRASTLPWWRQHLSPDNAANVAVILDFFQVHGEDSRNRSRPAASARVQPGVVLDHPSCCRREAPSPLSGLTPASHDRCTLGGMIGNNFLRRPFRHGRQGPTTTSKNSKILTYDGLRMKVGATSPEELKNCLRG